MRGVARWQSKLPTWQVAEPMFEVVSHSLVADDGCGCLTLPVILPRASTPAPRGPLATGTAPCSSAALAAAAAVACCRCRGAAGVPQDDLAVVAAPHNDVRVQGVVLKGGHLVRALQHTPKAAAAQQQQAGQQCAGRASFRRKLVAAATPPSAMCQLLAHHVTCLSLTRVGHLQAAGTQVQAKPSRCS